MMFGPALVFSSESSGADCTRLSYVAAYVDGCIPRSIPFSTAVADQRLLSPEQLHLCYQVQSSVLDYQTDLRRVLSWLALQVGLMTLV